MVAASPSPSGRRLAGPPRQLRLPSWPWRITWAYLGFVLFLPLATMVLKAAGVGPAGFWQMATTPVALASYKISFGIAALASLINGVFGLIIACQQQWRSWGPHQWPDSDSRADPDAQR